MPSARRTTAPSSRAPSSRAPSPRAPSAAQLTLLEFLAEHRVVRANQVAKLLGISLDAANRRLRRLADEGYVNRGRLYDRQPGHVLITSAGLRAIGTRRPAPTLRTDQYRHDIGLAWVWLAARSGAFGPLRGIVSERHMSEHDARAGAGDEHFAVGRIGHTRHGGHLPDLLLHTASGHTVAVELELTHKGDRRLDGILARYGADHRIDAVLYLVDDPRLARRIRASAARVGVEDLVHVRPVRWSEQIEPPGPERGRGLPHDRTARTARTAGTARPARPVRAAPAAGHAGGSRSATAQAER